MVYLYLNYLLNKFTSDEAISNFMICSKKYQMLYIDTINFLLLYFNQKSKKHDRFKNQDL